MRGAGVARGETAASALALVLDAMGAARANLVTAEKQENEIGIRARRDAKSGVRNALASSGAEIQGNFEFSSKKNDNRNNKKCKGFTLRFLAARATARFCWCTWC